MPLSGGKIFWLLFKVHNQVNKNEAGQLPNCCARLCSMEERLDMS